MHGSRASFLLGIAAHKTLSYMHQQTWIQKPIAAASTTRFPSLRLKFAHQIKAMDSCSSPSLFNQRCLRACMSRSRPPHRNHKDEKLLPFPCYPLDHSLSSQRCVLQFQNRLHYNQYHSCAATGGITKRWKTHAAAQPSSKLSNSRSLGPVHRVHVLAALEIVGTAPAMGKSALE